MKTPRQEALNNAFGIGFFKAYRLITTGETNLKANEKLLLLTIIGYMNWSQDGRAFPSVSTLAKQVHCTERTIRRLKGELTRKGWIVEKKTMRKGGGFRCEYYPPLVIPADGVTVRPPKKHFPPQYSGRSSNGQFAETPSVQELIAMGKL